MNDVSMIRSRSFKEMRKWLIAGSAASMLLTACGAASPSDDGNSNTDRSGRSNSASQAETPAMVAPTASTGTGTAPVASVDSLLKESSEESGPSYATFRKVAMSEGWMPVTHPDCQEGVYGADGAPAGQANICEALPEIESCNSNGLCLMRFEHKSAGKSLSVTTYGDYSAWNSPDREGALFVQGGAYE